MAAGDVRGTGVTVNCVVPSIIDTPANRAAMPAAKPDAWPKVADVARAYLLLAAPESGLGYGAAIPVWRARQRHRARRAPTPRLVAHVAASPNHHPHHPLP